MKSDWQSLGATGIPSPITAGGILRWFHIHGDSLATSITVKSKYALAQQSHLQEFGPWICLQMQGVARVQVTPCSIVLEKEIKDATISFNQELITPIRKV